MPCGPSPCLSYRAIAATDQAALADLFERLSERSRRLRFHAAKPHLSDRELAYFTDVDHRRHEAVVAVDAGGRFAGVARYACAPGESNAADIAIAVADAWQGCGVGTELARRVVAHARRNGIGLLRATTLAGNRPARRLLRELGFTVRAAGPGGLELELPLAVSAAA